jgi:putative oxygen-independent coproporphyrinogen III oxidase
MKIEDPGGLYIHVPFCRTKCPYCDFFSLTSTGGISAWCDAVNRESTCFRDLFRTFDSVYFGGGTPSVLNPSQLAGIITHLKTAFRITSDCEWTLEMNPDDVTGDAIAAYLSMGINRISLGVQSLNDTELRFLGRRHDARQAVRAMEICREAGCVNLSVDIIYGLPKQKIQKCINTIENILAFNPQHLSCYQLTLAAGTPLFEKAERDAFHNLSDDEQARFFIELSRFLTAHGYHHYEVSNYSSTPDMRCRHNMTYWTHKPYLGLGPSAHSFDGCSRWWNPRNLEQYCDRVKHGLPPAEDRERLTMDQLHLEQLSLGFRTSTGVGMDLIQRYDNWESKLDSLTSEGLLTIRNNRAIPTTKGFLVADTLPLAFV